MYWFVNIRNVDVKYSHCGPIDFNVENKVNWGKQMTKNITVYKWKYFCLQSHDNTVNRWYMFFCYKCDISMMQEGNGKKYDVCGMQCDILK